MGRTACTEPQCLYKGALYLLMPWSRKSIAIPLLPTMGRTACTEPQCLYKGALYLLVLWSRKSIPIPLLPTMGRTACTEPQCLYRGGLYLLVPWSRKSRAIPLPPYGPYGLYRASVPVQGCTLPSSAVVKKEYSYTSTPLWAVRPVQSLSACTGVHFTLFTLPVLSMKNVSIKKNKVTHCYSFEN